jgi:hypothetical protein
MAEATPHARQYARDLLARKDIRGLTALLPSLALAEDDEALFVLSCVSRGINSNKLTQRIVHLGQTFLGKARPHVKDLSLGVLGLELQARRAGLSSTILANFSDNGSMMNHSPLHQMPEEALLLFLASSDWLPWSSLQRLRSSLLQRSPLPSPRNPPPGAASDTHHVQALAMVRSVQADCDIELLLARLLAQGRGVDEVLHNPDRESRSFTMATGLLDAASASASVSASVSASASASASVSVDNFSVDFAGNNNFRGGFPSKMPISAAHFREGSDVTLVASTDVTKAPAAFSGKQCSVLATAHPSDSTDCSAGDGGVIGGKPATDTKENSISDIGESSKSDNSAGVPEEVSQILDKYSDRLA